MLVNVVIGFQSTHPSWGATILISLPCLKKKISIHAPIVGCDHVDKVLADYASPISIHAPIVGCDSMQRPTEQRQNNFNPRTHRGVRLTQSQGADTPVLFQSTHPSWGATDGSFAVTLDGRISIHAPIVGCDGGTEKAVKVFQNFNPRTHRGVRRCFF